MLLYEDYTKEKKRALGAFYTPNALADYLANVTLSLCKLDTSNIPCWIQQQVIALC